MRSETYMSKINLQQEKLTVENRKSREKNGYAQTCTDIKIGPRCRVKLEYKVRGWGYGLQSGSDYEGQR